MEKKKEVIEFAKQFNKDEIEKLKQENEKLRKCVEFYAKGLVRKDDYSECESISTYSFTGLNRKNSGIGEVRFVEQRFGKLARQTLKELEE